MPSAKRTKRDKKSSRDKRKSKKRFRNKSSRSWSWNDDLSGLYIDDINEAIRTRKCQWAYGNGSWKLVPKDSCEVYKDRQRRASNDKKSELSTEEISNDTECGTEEGKAETKKKSRKKPQSKSTRKKRSNSPMSTSSSSSESTCYTNKSHLDDGYY